MQRQLEYTSSNSPNQQSKTLILPMQPAQNRYSSPAETRNHAQTKERTPGAAEFTTPTKSTKMDVDDGEGYWIPEKRYESTLSVALIDTVMNRSSEDQARKNQPIDQTTLNSSHSTAASLSWTLLKKRTLLWGSSLSNKYAKIIFQPVLTKHPMWGLEPDCCQHFSHRH